MTGPTLADPSGIVVAVTGGRVAGVQAAGVIAFKGIPFAAPPVGQLRWRDPAPVKAWQGVRSATEFAPACAQLKPPFGLPASEDCLYLNVWTAASLAGQRRPVLVWIHGGGFTAGATAEPPYEGARFAQDGVVLVSVAYRLGPFGFLAHEQLDREADHPSGNYALRDLIAALRWVRANITGFGGDPDRVTVAGESAGATAVGLLAAMPAAHGLFRAVIAESGSAFRAPRYSLFTPDDSGPLQTQRHAESVGSAVLMALGAPGVAAARALPTQTVLEAVHGRGDLWTGPAMDGQLLPGSNRSLYAQGRFNDTPVLVGSNSDESGGRAPPTLTREVLSAEVDQSACPQALRSVLAGYPFANDADAKRTAELIMRDEAPGWDAWTWARWQSRKGRSAAYLYYFDFRLPKFPGGAGHWMEVPYVFGNFGWFDEQHMVLRPEDLAFSHLIRSYWINFVKTGNPNGPAPPRHADLPPWPAFNEHTGTAFVFDQDSSARELPNLERLRAIDVWHSCEWDHRGF